MVGGSNILTLYQDPASEGIEALLERSCDASEGVENRLAHACVLELTQRMHKGDESAFATFHEQYAFRLFRYAYVLCRGNEENAKEVVQEALVRVVRYIKPLPNEQVFWSWLTVLARSAAADFGRKQSRLAKLKERFRLTSELNRVARSSSEERRELEELLDAALRTLSEEERQLVVEKYFHRNSYQQLARTFETTERAIEGRLARARSKLRSAILSERES